MDNFTQQLLQVSSVFQGIPLDFKHEGIVTCSICEAEFSNLRGLRLHEGRIHSDSEKNIKCCECLRLFKNKYSLKTHVKQVHHKATREPCVRCGKVLYNKYMLKKHIKKCHPPIASIE
jgi:uncharacterized Zn-finger protein